ncbi:MAG: FdhF/YdeP family oxidoreductase [Phycisphaerae bacterium]|nr:FdhF/YdeP family oxidoreductase [Phycisphaerae bacterium]
MPPVSRASLKDRLRVLVPFGLGQTKPTHFRDMLRVGWENRDNLAYAWKLLKYGACDGCALGVAGLHDWTLRGIHLCTTRLNLLRLNTMPAMDPALLSDVARLQRLDNRQLRLLGRLAYPMLRRRGDPGFCRIDWGEAIDLAARCIRQTHPSRLAFYLTSRGITNEVYYVAQKVARYLGTNNIDNAARLCHSPSTGAMKATLGYAASTCSYRDWYGADLIVFFGSNPANDQPVAMKYLVQARRLGTRVALVNPHFEPGMQRYYVPSDLRSAVFGSRIADHWFAVSHGGDIAFLNGVIRILFEKGWEDAPFLRDHVVGTEELREYVASLAMEELERQSGLSSQRMQEFAQLLHQSPRTVFVWSMGITQHSFGGDAVQAILNLALVRGCIGRANTGVMPIRGHSGVQGGAEMGAYATAFPGGKPINEENARSLSEAYGFEVPACRGLSAPEMVEAAHRGELDVLYCVGGNFLRTLPEPEYVATALSRLGLRVHQDIILTDQMLLPAQTRYEQDGGGTQTSTERRVMFSPCLPRTVGEARAEWRILRDIAAAARPERAQRLGCDSGEAIRREISRIIPEYAGIEALRATGDSFQIGGPRLCDGGRFNTPDGRARLRPVPLPHRPLPPGALRLSTRRGKQFNTIVFEDHDPLTGAPRDAVLINPDDAAALHLRHGDRVILRSDVGQMPARVFLSAIAPGNVQVHWPEGNVLIGGGRVDPVGGVPDYNTVVRIEAERRG